MHSTHNQKVLPWMSHWQTTIGSPNTAEKYRRPNRVDKIIESMNNRISLVISSKGENILQRRLMAV